MTHEKKMIPKVLPTQTATMVETIYGCKWSLTVFSLLRNGINRPGEMVRSVEGLTTKVLNTCLKKNLEFGIMKKEVFAELPPRVEYSMTPFGKEFIAVLDQIEELNKKIDQKLF